MPGSRPMKPTICAQRGTLDQPKRVSSPATTSEASPNGSARRANSLSNGLVFCDARPRSLMAAGALRATYSPPVKMARTKRPR